MAIALAMGLALIGVANGASGAGAAGAIVSASPTTGLGWRTPVHLEVDGFGPAASLRVTQCFADDQADADCEEIGTGIASSSGRGSLDVVAIRYVVGEEDGGDCWDPNTDCRLVVSDGQSAASVVVTFDRTTPAPPAPALTVTPNTGLPATATVAVHAAGLLSNGRVTVEQCTPAGVPSRCTGRTAVRADALGRLDLPLTVARFLGGFPFDCATSPRPCVVTMASEGHVTNVAVHFDPATAIPPRPVVTVSPSTGIADGQELVVRASGFSPHRLVASAPCSANVAGTSQCDTSSPGLGVTDSDGNLELRLHAPAVIFTSDGPVDCRIAPGICVVAVATFDEFDETAVAPIGFASAAPPGPSTVGVGGVSVGERSRWVQVPVLLFPASGHSVTVEYRTHHGTARSGSDFVRTKGSVTFAPGTMLGWIRIPIVDDVVREPTETFTVEIGDATRARVVRSTANVTILDDD
jgi:Neocarzinostatin family./Calx-beta domain.